MLHFLILIMQNFSQNIPLGARVKSTTPNRRKRQESPSEDDIESTGQPIFEAHNYLYELQSRCNNLQYQKTKSAMYHDAQISELKYKNGYLEQLSSTLSQQNQSLSEERDLLRTLLAQIREQNFSFSKEISQMRIEMNNLVNHSSIEGDNVLPPDSMKEDMTQKDEMIKHLQQQLIKLESSKEPSRVEQLQKKNLTLRQELDQSIQRACRTNRELEQIKTVLSLKEKDHGEKITDLENEIKTMKQENDTIRKKIVGEKLQETKRITDLLQIKEEQLRNMENERLELESKFNELSLQVGRLKCQKANLQQLNEYLQTTVEESEVRRKNLQEQVFRGEKEMSQLRSQLFNEKLEYKKELSSLKLEFQEQRIKHLEAVQDKAKEVNRLRQQNSCTSRQALDIEELSIRTQGMMTDLDRANQQISFLSSQNETLLAQLKSTQAKLEQKQEKYCALEVKLKMENQQRIKALQNEIYKLQGCKSELEVQVELLERKTNSGKCKTQPHKQTLEMMKLEQQEKDQRIRELEQQVRELKQKNKNNQQEIVRLEGDLRLGREIRCAGSDEDKITTIELLNKEIDSLNKEIEEERRKDEREKKDSQKREEKMKQDLRILQDQNKKIYRENEHLRTQIQRIQSDLSKREHQREELREEIRGLVRERQDKQNWEAAMKEKVKEERKVVAVQSQKQFSKGPEKDFNDKILELQKENLALKLDYSSSLQQINQLLFQYQSLQQKYNLVIEQLSKNKKDGHSYKLRITQLETESQRLRSIITELESEQRYYLKTINELKRENASFSFGTDIARTNRRASEQLWLDKNSIAVERNLNEVNGNHHPRCRHRL